MLYNGPQFLDTDGVFLRLQKDRFRLPVPVLLFPNRAYRASSLPAKHVTLSPMDWTKLQERIRWTTIIAEESSWERNLTKRSRPKWSYRSVVKSTLNFFGFGIDSRAQHIPLRWYLLSDTLIAKGFGKKSRKISYMLNFALLREKWTIP